MEKLGGGWIRGNNSHVKAQVLLLLKEVVQDELPDKVRVQRVVDHFGPPKLDQNQSGQKQTDEWSSTVAPPSPPPPPPPFLRPSETRSGRGRKESEHRRSRGCRSRRGGRERLFTLCLHTQELSQMIGRWQTISCSPPLKRKREAAGVGTGKTFVSETETRHHLMSRCADKHISSHTPAPTDSHRCNYCIQNE